MVCLLGTSSACEIFDTSDQSIVFFFFSFLDNHFINQERMLGWPVTGSSCLAQKKKKKTVVQLQQTFSRSFFLIMDSQTPRIVSLLSESYNPHVRYGAALAVGISCAGTGSSEAISLLEPLTSDVVDFVRQGALLAMAMVMIQINEAYDFRVGMFRYVLPQPF